MTHTPKTIDHHKKSFQKAVKKHAKLGSPSHHSNRKRTLMIVLVAALIIVGVSASAYAYMWYQSPERIVMNAVLNTTSASSLGLKGTVTVNNDPITFDGRLVQDNFAAEVSGLLPIGNRSITARASLVGIGDTTYVKSDQLGEYINSSTSDQNAIIRQIAGSISQSANGKWVELDSDSTSLLSGGDTGTACLVDFVQKVSADQQSRLQVVDLYRQNPFINVDQVSNADKRGVYDMTVDLPRFVAFKAALKSTELHKSMIACTNDTPIMTEDEAQDLTIRMTIDLDKTKVSNVTVNNAARQTTLTTAVMYDAIEPVAKPSGSVRLSDLKADGMRAFLADRLLQLRR